MATTITGRHYEVTDKIRDLITTKLDKITEKFFDRVIEVRVVLQVEKYRNICEIHVTGKEHVVTITANGDFPGHSIASRGRRKRDWYHSATGETPISSSSAVVTPSRAL